MLGNVLLALTVALSPTSAAGERGLVPLAMDPASEHLDAFLSIDWDDDAREWIDRTLASLTLREKVGQMVMPWIPGGRIAPGSVEWRRAVRAIREDGVGGFIVGKGPGTGTVTTLNALQHQAALPLLIAADLEWGPGTRLDGATIVPMNMALAASGDASLAREAGRITGIEARAAGIHMAFAPVADVNVNPRNPVINTRAYGGEPELVARWVSAFIRGAREGGVLTVAKHFPGHGDTHLDSHLALPLIPVSRARLDAVELVPFRAAVAAAVDGVMTAHVAVPSLDPLGGRTPATLSRAIITGLLREELGFNGLIVTDALNMDGVRAGRSTGEIALGAVLAGADILLMPSSSKAAVEALVAAVELGWIDEARVDASVRRILAAKAAMGLPAKRTVDPVRAAATLGAAEHVVWAERAAERSMTLVRARPDLLPLTLPRRQVVVIAYDHGRNRRIGGGFEQLLQSRGAQVRSIRLWRGSTAAELRAAERAAAAADVVVFSAYTRAVPWSGLMGLPTPIANHANRLVAAGALVVSFGDPYLLTQIPGASTYLLAWSDTRAAQRAAARALTGEIRVTGRLPTALPPFHAVGEGIAWPVVAEAGMSTDELRAGPLGARIPAAPLPVAPSAEGSAGPAAFVPGLRR